MDDRRRVIVLTSDTGAGHRSVSSALIDEARCRPETRLELVDVDPFRPLPSLPGSDAPPEPLSFIDRIVPLYGPVIVRTPWLWALGFHLANNEPTLQAYLAVFGAVLSERIALAVQRTSAVAVVSVHPLVNHAMVRARQRLRRHDLPLMTVVTDLVDVHRWWAAPEVDQYVVASDLAAEVLLHFGVRPSGIAQLGIPIRREFSEVDRSGRDMRLKLGLDPDLPVVVLMGGGDGAGRIAETARAIAGIARQGAGKFQLVVLTGRNRKARDVLAGQTWPIPATVHGTIHNVAEYMIAADVVVTKPGSLTLSEGLAMARPLVVGKPIPGQEEGNVRYVVDAGAGLHYRDPQEAAGAVAYLLKDPAARWEMGQRAMRLSKPRATERTMDTLRALVLNAQKGGTR